MRTCVTDKSFLSGEGDVNLLLSQHFVDFTPPSFGFVSMYSVDRNGKPRLHYKEADRNVVVHNSRKILAKLLAYGRVTGGDPLDDYVVTKCKFGNRNQPNDTMVTTAEPYPTVDDTSLVDTDPFVVQGTNFKVDSVVQQENSNAWAVTFNIVMDLNEGYTKGGDSYRNYTEMGLFSTNNTMYARKTFPSFIKLADRKLVVFWTIVF